jgi:hypothetical protein
MHATTLLREKRMGGVIMMQRVVIANVILTVEFLV